MARLRTCVLSPKSWSNADHAGSLTPRYGVTRPQLCKQPLTVTDGLISFEIWGFGWGLISCYETDEFEDTDTQNNEDLVQICRISMTHVLDIIVTSLERYGVKLKSRESLFVRNIRTRCPIVLKFCTEYDSIDIVICTKLQKGWTTAKKICANEILRDLSFRYVWPQSYPHLRIVSTVKVVANGTKKSMITNLYNSWPT